MSENHKNVVCAFGKFLVKVGDNIVTYDTADEANAAAVMEESSAEINATVAAYCADKGFEGKNAVAKARIISDYLVWKKMTEGGEEVPAE